MYYLLFNRKFGQNFPRILPFISIVTGVTSTLGVIFENFYMCVSLMCKDKVQDNYSIFQINFNELHPNCQFQVTRKWPEAQY